jgi:hypothetical protein
MEMSFWYEVEDIVSQCFLYEDVSLDEKGEEIHLYLYSDEFGAVYASVSVELRETNNHLAEDIND